MSGYPIRIMLAGIALMMIGIYIQIDIDNNWRQISFLFEIAGFLLVLIGLLFEPLKRFIDK